MTLLARGADPSAIQGRGQAPPLILAARAERPVEVFAALLSAGADVNARDKWGHSALTLAFAKGRFELVELLQRSGAREPPSLGVFAEEPAEASVVVRNVLVGSAADELDLRPGDRIVSLGELPIAGMISLHQALAAMETGRRVTLVWWRAETQLSGAVRLGPRAPASLKFPFTP